ncbi:hydroxyisourate hydrolase [Paenibacillus albus]|uniref:5-hydroxyisourate hydrolase n=1 Tax=Paenibacillus albus TaxID=2495582 RepID=A0A3S9A753_9BACL|nr:hydroxyisourate hydrolase [Paenibacillus albus]AZN41565.1 hydroxyisourate hydrolase [Paenibacillus albus]
MSGRLTTHVLDLALGKPAKGMTLELWRINQGNDRELLRHAVTNADGRLDAPLLAGEECSAGIYELVFKVGDYYLSCTGPDLCDPELFLDVVPIRFCLRAADEHYHVPLLVAPGGYSTYRGS